MKILPHLHKTILFTTSVSKQLRSGYWMLAWTYWKSLQCIIHFIITISSIDAEFGTCYVEDTYHLYYNLMT